MIANASLREYFAELIGTAILVFFGAGIATVVFGFRAFGSSVAAGILLTGLMFGLVLIGLYTLIGHISGCHVNPAVTLGAYLCRRISLRDAIGYWIAQLIGGILGALLLLWVMHSSPFYTRSRNGLGANGWGGQSLLHVSAGGAFLAEVILTAVFVLIVLSATRRGAPAAVTGLIMGFGLALVITLGAPIDGGAVNPARSLGPAVVIGGTAINQVWLFIIAPLIGAIIGAAAYLGLHPEARPSRLMGPSGEAGERPSTLSAGGQDQTGSGGTTPQPGQVGTRPGSATGTGAAPGAGAARPGQSDWRDNPPQGQPPGGNPRR
ncbi:MAG TPA: aquaporin [Streptosporangiaceae bacterium]